MYQKLCSAFFALHSHIFVLSGEGESMESIKRKLLLLRSDAQNKGGATLKLAALKDGVSANLSAIDLPNCLCALYLWDNNGKEYCAGNIADGRLSANLCAPALDDVAGAAVIEEPNGAFLLKTLDYNWETAATSFRLSRIQSAEYSLAAERQTKTADAEYVNADNAYSTQEPMADTVFYDERDPRQAVCGSCPHVIRQDKINPFPSVFPQSEWVKISYPGPAGWWHYISGKILRGDKIIAKALGVPGEYGMAPPIWLEGFGTYMRCSSPDAHGYWLMFQDAQTGEVLDMALSPHDE